MRAAPYAGSMRCILIGIALLFCIATRAADAEPCPIETRYAAHEPNANVYAIGFSSNEKGIADLTLTLYAGTETYAATLPATTFVTELSSQPGSLRYWESRPVYLRLPNAAPALDGITLAIENPDTNAALACSGGNYSVATPPRATASKKSVPDDSRAADRALTAFGADTATVDALLRPAAQRPGCAKPYVPARLANVAPLAYPGVAQSLGHVGTALIAVEVAPDGSQVSDRIVRTTGWPELDAAAKKSATDSSYVAEIFHCEPVAGTYLFQAEFSRSI